MNGLRTLIARNPGPFTLDGTRTHLVGVREVAVVDPGPHDADHLEALESVLEGARAVRIVLTHHHADHAAAAGPLAHALGAPVLCPPLDTAGAEWEGGSGAPGPELGGEAGRHRVLVDGDRVSTDQGELVALATPGHARAHLSFHWPRGRGLFPGDLLMGEGDTTWVGEYPGCVADYLRSLDRLGALEREIEVAFPAHGPPIRPFAGTIARYRRHREERIRQVEEFLRRRPDAGSEEVLEAIYGDGVPQGLRGAARRSVEALLHHVREG